MDWLGRMECRWNKTFRRTLLTVAVSIGVLVPPFAIAQEQPATLPALNVVLLVDQSGSLSEQAVVAEKEAARAIAASVLGPGSVMSVVGFASAEKTGQSAVDAVCHSIRLDGPQQRDTLAKCIGDVRKRKDDEGDGTDHAAALQQALTYVTAPKPEKKVVFLLTDGKLDVTASESWGDTPDRRNAAAAARAQELLGELDKAGAQVWPLGFGDVDVSALRGFAKGRSCTPGVPDPQERVVPNIAELTTAVSDAFSSAACVKIPPADNGRLPDGGGTVELHVDIPAVASDASIVVHKRHKAVQVEYRAPGADKPVSGPGFEFAGQETESESLRITDPEPGRWTIKLSSSGLPAQEVAATVVYQAAVKGTLVVSPPQPAAGETVEASMQVRARGKAVIDPDTLKGLTFVTAMTGAGPNQEVTLTDPDGDGTFTGQFKIPDDATGDLTFTGRVTGLGVGGDTRVLPTRVLKGQAPIQAQILFDQAGPVYPGSTLTGTANVTNNSGQPVALRLSLEGVSEGATMTLEPATVQAGNGTSNTPFTIRFGADSRLGPSSATLQLVDNTNAVVGNRLLNITVEAEPGILEKLWWLWAALVVVLIGLAIWLLPKHWRRVEASRTRGLRAQLWREGVVVSDLEPTDPKSKAFRFVLHQEITGWQLQDAGSGDSDVFEARREGGQISLTRTGAQPVLLAHGTRHDIGQEGMQIAVVDERGSVSAPLSGPPPDPFRSSTVEPSYREPFQAPPTQQLPSNPYDSGTNGRHTADRGSYVDPNNPFA